MKPNRSNPLFARFFGASLTSLIVLSGVASAADVIKANNPLDLNQTSSWVGGVLPSATDVAVWDSTVTGAMNPGLGADASWLGLKILNPTGLVSVGTGGNVLNLGASGIDLSNATQSLILSPGTLNLTASQTWNVPSGRDIRLNGAGVGAGSSNVDGSGVITVQGGGLVDANQGTLAGAGFAGFSGKWIVGSGITLRGTGAGALAWGTSTAADTISLNGGTLAVGGISGTDAGYSWPQPITLGAATTSTISGQNTAVAATARELTLTGAITGSGNFNFSKTQTGGQVFAVANLGNTAGVRTNVLGTGNITVTGVTLQPRAGGTTNVITHNNNIKLVGATLISDDALQTFAGTISLEGANIVQARWGDKPATISGNIVDGGVSGGITYSGNTINVSGTNTYTGVTNISSGTVNISGTQTATSTENITGGIVNITGTQTTPGPVNITGGTVVVTSAKGLGNGLVTLDGAGITINPATPGATSSINSLRARNDVLIGNGVLLDVTSGNLQQRTTNGFWIKGSGTGANGRLTSSSGTLSLSSVDTNWAVTTGNLTNTDHQVQVSIVDFNGTTPLALVKNGVNHVGLTAANPYTGGTTINGGRVAASNSAGFGTGTVTVTPGGQAWLTAATGSYPNNFNISGSGPTEAVTTPATGNANYGSLRFNNNTLITGNVTVGAGGARILGVAASATISGSLTGTDPLEINSTDATASTATGTVILSGNASAYTGTTTVSRGGLTIGGAFGGTVVKNSGTTLIVNGSVAGEHTHNTGILQGTGTFGSNLNLNGATAADVLNVVPGALHVTGNLNLTGTTTVRASGLGGTVPVLYYGGTLTGTTANLALENPTSFRPGTQFDTSTPGLIKLAIVGVPITWTGSINTTWDNTIPNWNKSGSADKYFQSDMVSFGDTGSGTISIVGAIAPSSITINNSATHDYTFTGAAGNAITGTTGITKTGAGALTLNSNNSFLGAVSLGGGVSTFSAQQAYTGGTTISSGAVLDLTGGGGQGGVIRGTANVNGGTLRLSTGDATGWGTGTDRIGVLNITNGGTLEINNNANNETLSNLAITLTGSSIVKGAAGYNGNIDLYNGNTTITTLASATTSVIGVGVNLGLRQPVTTITTALGTAGVDLQIDGTLNNSSVGFTNPALVKEGPGTLVLNNDPAPVAGNAIYTGTTTINAGTLVVGTGGTSGLLSAGAIIDNGSLVFNRSDDLTPANVITGTGSLTQLGGGVLTLVNGGSRSGETIVTGSRINIGTVPFTASTFRVNANGTLGTSVTGANSTGSVAGLVMNGGTLALRVNTALSDKILVSGGVTVSAASSIALTPSGNLQKDDIIPLIDYNTTITGFSNLSIAATGNPHLSFALVNNTTDTRVDAKVTAADTLIWKGNLNGGVWDKTTLNWTTTSTGAVSKFYDYDKVKFTNAAGSTNTAVALSEETIPNTVEFDSTFNYTLSGGGIAGVASLVKNNTGTATLMNFNTYTGPTTINAGTLAIGDGGSLGATAITINAGTLEIGDNGSLGSATVINNGTFAYNQSGPATFADVISGTGQLVKRGLGTVTLSGASTFTGPVVVKEGTLIVGNVAALGTNASGVVVESGGTLDINAKVLPAGETVSIAGTGDVNSGGFALTSTGGPDGNIDRIESNLILTASATVGNNTNTTTELGNPAAPATITGAFTLTKAGTSKFWYRAPENGVGNSLAAVVVNGGTFGIEANSNGLSGVPITVNPGAILSAWGDSTGAAATTQNNPITLHGGALAADYLGETWSGPVTLTADSALSGAGSGLSFNISGVISQSGGSYGLIKGEATAVTLTAVNTYTGNTTVNAGSIILADNAALKFVIGANGVNNKITGVGAATIDGDFILDLSGAAIANGNSWTLVDTATKTFDATFTIPGFTKSGNVHTKVVGTQTWTFSEATGVLSLSVSGGSGFDSWIAGFPTLPLDQRGPSADYDADGLSNLLEYALGGSPVVSDAASIVPAGVRSGSNFVVTFKRTDLSEADTTQVLQYGNDLAGWTNVPIGASPGSGMVSISENTPTADLDTVTVTIPTTGASKFFTRLKVSKP